MRPIATLGLTLILSSISIAATAQDEDVYVGLAIESLEGDSQAVGLRVGYDFTDYIGVEAQGTFGFTDKDFEISDTLSGDVGLNYLVGGYAIGRLPISESFNFLARGGYYFGEIGVDLESNAGIETDLDADINGFSAGVGFEYLWGFSKEKSVRLEYTFLDVDDVSAGGVDQPVDTGGDLFSLVFASKF